MNEEKRGRGRHSKLETGVKLLLELPIANSLDSGHWTVRRKELLDYALHHQSINGVEVGRG